MRTWPFNLPLREQPRETPALYRFELTNDPHHVRWLKADGELGIRYADLGSETALATSEREARRIVNTKGLELGLRAGDLLSVTPSNQ